MATLKDAFNCIEVMKESKTYRGEEVGIITKPFSGFVTPNYQPGTVVLYKKEVSPDIDVSKKDLGTLIVEIPMSQAGIDKEKLRGSFITTFRTIVGVPKSYVKKAKI